MKKQILLTLLFTVLSFAGYSQTIWNTYDTETFSVKYPSYYEVSEPPYCKLAISFLPIKKNDSFIENISIDEITFPKDSLNLDDYTKALMLDIKNTIKKSKVQKMTKVISGGVSYNQFICTGTLGNVAAKSIICVWQKENTIYVLKFMSEKKEFESTKDMALKIIASFTIK